MFLEKHQPARRGTLVLHIGMHKTGSTAIQASMSQSRSYLLSKGINYLSGVRMNHSTTFVSMFCEEPCTYHINIQEGIDTSAKAKKHNKKLARTVKRAFEENASGVFVVSGEGLSILPESGVRDLKEFLLPYFNDIKVVCYVRAPIAFYKSMCQQYIVGGRTEDKLMVTPPLPEYEFRIAKYVENFGEKNVFVKPYDRKYLKNGDIVDDFLSFLGVKDADLFCINRISTNESFSSTGVQVLDLINQRIPVTVGGVANADRGPLIRRAFLRAAERSSDRKFQIPVCYGRGDIEKINRDILYVNRFLSKCQTFDQIGAEDIDATEVEKRELDPGYLAELVNELQQVAERRRVRINNLERQLANEKRPGILKRWFGK